MKTKIHFTVLTLLVFLTLNSRITTAFAQGTAFTYQGRLNDGSGPANGSYDLRFALFDALTSGTQQGNLLTNSATAVSNGLFTVTLDFGGQFPGASRWLEIGVRTNGAATFTTLSPRQQLVATPYAVTAGNVVSGGLGAGSYGNAVAFNNAANSFNGSFSGNGFSVTNVNAAALGGLASSNFWQLGGNNVAAGQFLGSTNNQPVVVKVHGLQAWQITPLADDPTHSNMVNVAAGSPVNYIAPGVYGSVIAGGGASFYGSGIYTTTNSVAADMSVVGGGGGNSVGTNADYSIVGGGIYNSIGTYSSHSVVVGGQDNSIWQNADGAFIGGGYHNFIDNNAEVSVIVGGSGNHVRLNAVWSAIVGGWGNQVLSNAWYGFIGGGQGNTITNAVSATISGGEANWVAANYGTIGGGSANQVLAGDYSVIAGGNGNVMSANFSASADSVIGGGENNTNNGVGSVIAGGSQNAIVSQGVFTTSDTIGGGFFNSIGYATQFGGTDPGSDTARTIAGGGGNFILVGGGFGTIGGGLNNAVLKNGQFGTIPGGRENEAADYAFAAGYRARATNSGSFVWADGSSGSGFNSTATNQFLIRATGNVGINTNNPTSTLTVNGQIAATSLRSPGAGINSSTYAFTQRVVSTNVSGNITVIFNPITDNDPNAILIITHNWTADTNSVTKYNTTPVGVYYYSPHWAIFNEDFSAMALGRAFNVLVIKP